MSSKLENLVRDFVTRARAGDQNAQGMLQTIGRQARDPAAPMRLKVTAKLVEQEIKGNAVKYGPFGADTTDTRQPSNGKMFRNARHPKAFPMVCMAAGDVRNGEAALVALFVNGPRLKPSALSTYERDFASTPTAPQCRAVLQRAQALQMVRDGVAPLSAVSTEIAWEAGE